MADQTVCDLQPVAIENDPCLSSPYPLGQQIRTLLYQDSSGTAPDLRGTKATPATLAQVQAAIAADAPNKVYVLRDVSGGLVPAAADTTITGNDVPGGGTRLINRTRTVTGRTDNIQPALIDAVNAHNRRGGDYRVWLVDNIGYFQGPIANATIVFGNLERAGINGASNRIPFTVSYISIDEPALGFAPLPGVNYLANA